ncbi:MAG: choline dehydrogenase [Ilumatobacteraceae bacterium]|nr:choline dehydrogenase [Ilumatobacteraceae bacterium]MBJ7422002.1 choline dehydrogenase [Ilumatobacteraceae bacterium]
MKKLKTVYDYVIVGGGSAGSALANRLSANPNNKVLVLEAGRPDYWWDVFIHMPAALTFPIGSRFYDWLYVSEPEPNMNNRRVTQGRGKVLGGSSSINGMIFQRGNPLDYQRWASDPGMGTWDYAHCLPYFKRLENCLAADPDDQFRGHDGPLQQERGPIKNPLFSAFFKAVQQAGHELTTDVNGYKQEGFAAFDRNLRRGRRLSAARAYLHPVMHRKNLTVKCRALVTKLNIENKKVTGVNFELPFGRKRTVDAKEVVLCGGTFNSPQLLQVSGIGNSQHLKSVGVEPVHHLPGVGENLQDHLEVYVQHSCSQPVSLNPMLKLHYRPFIGLAWLFRRGPGASNHFEGGGFIRGNQSFKYPNLMFHFLPIAVRYDGTAPAGGHGYQVHIGPMYSNSRGSVRIKSPDVHVKPELRLNYLSTPEDRQEWVEAIAAARKILAQPAFKEFDGGEISPSPAVATDEQILDWVRKDGETAYHPSCTCRMGVDEMSVVDPLTMGVRGIVGLRIVDASVMPYVTNGNIYAPTMMIAEKAADIILGVTPLEPENVNYFSHSN